MNEMWEKKSSLLRPSLLYFFYFAVNASAGRFISLFFLDYGLTDSQVGLILGAGTTASLLCKPIIGLAADIYGSKIVLLTGSIISAVFFLCNFFATSYEGAQRFWLMSLLWALRSPFNVTSIVDGFTVIHLAEMEDDGMGDLSLLSKKEAEDVKSARTSAYGQCRLWGAVSWAITNVAIGALMDQFGSRDVMLLSTLITTALFIALVIAVVPDQGDTEKLKRQQSSSDKKEETKEKDEDVGDTGLAGFYAFLGTLVRSPYTLVFFFVTLCLGAGSALVEGMMFLYFREHLHASNLLCGISVVITVSFEIPLFAFSTTALERVGVDRLLTVSMVCYIARVFIYTLISPDHPEYLLFVEPTHGITYSCFTMASVQFIALQSPVGLENSAQTLLGLVRSVGSIAGTAGAGFLMAVYGPVFTYRTFAVLVTVALAVWLGTACMCPSPSSTSAAAPAGEGVQEVGGYKRVSQASTHGPDDHGLNEDDDVVEMQVL